ncbi:MAG: rab guanine nucleotide exchange factor S2 [Peltula sp. TS41687]|nr:MAG: rab guanine nucleotide exchange factor S2 [Peltula sp. TS41687]
MAATVAPNPVSGSLFGPSPSARSYNPINSPDHDSAPQLYHPDISSEVTALSNKLINAINYQTNLDDSLAATRMELEASRDRIRQLEDVNWEHEEMIANGTLVKRTEVENENEELKQMLEEESRQRSTVEKEKKSIEQELENLTTALFEEANQMVSAARHERDASERRNDQLRSQLKDAEELLASHQDQLTELKTVMQQLRCEREEIESNGNHSTAPTSPLLGNQDQLGKLFDALHLYPHTPGSDDIPPSFPTSFTHLLQPVLRTDLLAYQDFTSLLRTSRHSPSPKTRSTTVAQSGLNMVGLGSFGNHSRSNATDPSGLNGTSPAVGTGAAQNASPTSPSTPIPGQNNGAKDAVPLKETQFYKRVLVEDIEPTLRLDTAPGLSWLARRSVINSMSEGNLVVEPLPATPSLRVVTCSLCGERRRGEGYARTHQFRTNETENAQRYPLCNYCTGRVRATCDFLGFLRMVKDGHWRAEGGDAEKAAWEESVKLRESMFWARLGGGVIPAFLQTKQSPRNSALLERTAEQEGKASVEVVTEEDGTSDENKPKAGEDDLFHSDEKRVSIGTTVIYVNGKEELVEESAATNGGADDDVPATVESSQEGPKDSAADQADSATSTADVASKEAETPEPLSKPSGFSAGRGEQRLSITIPGSFD